MIQARVTLLVFLTFVCATAWLADVSPLIASGLWLLGVIGITITKVKFIPSHWISTLFGVGVSLVGGWLLLHAFAASNDDAPYWKLALVTFGLVAGCWHVALHFVYDAKVETCLAWGLASLFGCFANLTSMHPTLQILWTVLATALFVLAVEANHAHAEYLRYQSISWRFSLWTATISSVLLLLWPVEEYSMKSLTIVQTWAQDTIHTSLGNERGVRSYTHLALLDSVAFEKRNEAWNLALSVKSAFPPGYLRGLAFDTFHGRQWSAGGRRSMAEIRRMRSIRAEPHEAFKSLFPDKLFQSDSRPYFSLHPKANGPWFDIEISNQPRRGEVYFMPLGVEFLQASAESLWLDHHDIVRRGPNVYKSYRAILSTEQDVSELSPELESRLTRVPVEYESLLQPLAQDLCKSTTTDVEKIKAITEYFRSEYKYSLDGFDVPAGGDPLTYFFEQKPATHCEFFATGAALLLRAQGVPTRYVTGYLVTEQSAEDSTAWFALNRDAHAWTEAYDRESKRWVIVEATPGLNVPRTLAESLLAAQKTGNTNIIANQQSQELQEDNPFFSLRFSPQLAMRVFTWLSMATLVTVVGFIVWSYWKAWSAISPLGRQRWRLRQLLATVDRKLRGERLIRPKHETLQQFAQRLRQSPATSSLQHAAAQWYEDYAHLVYGQEPSEQDILELAQRTP